MYKILIVDDEPLVGLGIKASLKWEETDFMVAGEAYDGEEALNLVEKLRPDIVLTDIKMPKMDGITLLRHLRTRYPEVRVVILSCVNEAEMVRLALKMGASDYILKLSLKPNRLLEILNAVKADIKREQKEETRVRHMEGALKSNRQMVGSYLFQRLILNELELSRLDSTAQELHVDVGFHSVVLVYVTAMVRVGDIHKEDIEIRTSLEQIFDEIGRYYYFQYSSGIVVVIDGGETPKIREIANRIVELRTKAGLEASFGISDYCMGFATLQTQVNQAKEAWKQSFYEREPGVYLCRKDPLEYALPLPATAIGNIIGAFMNYGEQEAGRLLDRTVVQSVLSAPCDPGQVRNWFRQLCFELLHHVNYLYGLNIDLILHEDFYEAIKKLSTIYEINQYVQGVFRTVADNIQTYMANSDRKEIIMARQYVRLHIDKNVTLDEVAGYVSLSRSHFSTLFKQEQKESFTQFVNREKMEYAMELLKSQKLRVYEAARCVGIENENYFSKLFKKITGMTPSMLTGQNETKP